MRDLRTRVLGLKVINIYDIDNRTYTFKLAVPGGEKVTLLLESGARFHTTAYARERSVPGELPSVFAMKLRKYLRGKGLEDVRQLGMDRVVVFRFGQGEGALHLILELYASGNLVLTDANYLILALLRTHQYEQGPDKAVDGEVVGNDAEAGPGMGEGRVEESGRVVRVGHVYPLAFASNALAATRSSAAVEKDAGANLDPPPWLAVTAETVLAALREVVVREEGKAGKEGNGTSSMAQGAKRGRTKRGGQAGASARSKVNLKMALMTSKTLDLSGLGPAIVEHAVLEAGLRPLLRLMPPASTVALVEGGEEGEGRREGLTEEEAARLAEAVQGLDGRLKRLDLPGQEGYILCRKADGARARGGEEDEVMYEEFHPLRLRQHERVGRGVGRGGGSEGGVSFLTERLLARPSRQDLGSEKELRTFPSFDAAVDEFFARLEEQKMRQAARAQEEAVRSRPLRVQRENEARLKVGAGWRKVGFRIAKGGGEGARGGAGWRRGGLPRCPSPWAFSIMPPWGLFHHASLRPFPSSYVRYWRPRRPAFWMRRAWWSVTRTLWTRSCSCSVPLSPRGRTGRRWRSTSG